MTGSTVRSLFGAALAACLALSAGTAGAAGLARSKVRPDVVDVARTNGHADVLIVFRDAANLKAIARVEGRERRLAEASGRLRAVADASQKGVRALLDAHRVAHRDYWIANAIAARLPLALVDAIAARPEVLHVVYDRPVRMQLPPPAPVGAAAPKAVTAVEPGVTKVRAPEMWAGGFRGEGIVVAGADTGIRWDHEALRDAYRGWNGTSASHDFNWHDAIHSSITGFANFCPYSSPAPCDDNDHGTHTLGTVVGDGPTREIGVAPGARWIGCRNMDSGVGRPSTYTECFQFFMAPTDLAGNNANPALAPHVVNNSWACPPSEFCDAAEVELMRQVVEAVRAAGILVVVSAGNEGPSCETVTSPPAIYAASFTVGATNFDDTSATIGSWEFSSRGAGGTYGLQKPDVVAPGAGIVSATRASTSSYFPKSGTSMAGPHVAGAAALLMQAMPELIGDPAAIEAALRLGAVPLTSIQDCPGLPGANVPNAVFGHGRIDAVRSFDGRPVFADQFE